MYANKYIEYLKGDIKLKSTYGQGTNVNFIIPFVKGKSIKSLDRLRFNSENNRAIAQKFDDNFDIANLSQGLDDERHIQQPTDKYEIGHASRLLF